MANKYSPSILLLIIKNKKGKEIMHINFLQQEKNFKTLEEAFKIVSSNNNRSCTWVHVKTKAGCYFSLGGRNLKGKEFFYKAEIFKKGKAGWILNNNEMVKNNFSIEIESNKNDRNEIFCSLDIPTQHFFLNNKFKTVQEFLDFLDTTEDLNTRELQMEPVYTEVISHYVLKNI